jgi:hypothetical protein
MSAEEDPEHGIPSMVKELSLVTNSPEAVRRTALFRDFERKRAQKAYTERLFPCRICRFNDLTRPCTADLVKGDDEMEVDSCRAVLECGDEHVPGLREYVFPGATARDTLETVAG